MSGTRFGSAIQQIGRLFDEGTLTGLADSELLDRFLGRGDGVAFRILIERHGPMVLSVCRATLGNSPHVEDAFQATFLVLIRKAPTIRAQGALGAWLHRVAYRVAVASNIAETRRRRRERPISEATEPVTLRSTEALDDRDRLAALHNEIARLPEKYSRPIILCYLEGKSHAQAAAELACGEATLRRRLSGARDLLRSRLTRRGLAPAAAIATLESLASSAKAAVPTIWIETIAKAAASLPTGKLVATGAISASAVQLARSVSTTFLIGKLQGLAAVASAVLAFGMIGLHTIPTGLAQTDKGEAIQKNAPDPKNVSPPQPQPKTENQPQAYTFSGIVLDPDGKPFAGAKIHLAMYGLSPASESTVRAASGEDGRFRFTVSAAEIDPSIVKPPADRLNASLWAIAEGFAIGLGNVQKEGESPDLRLARDDEKIHGRIVDEKGKPVAGAEITVRYLQAANKEDLTQWLQGLNDSDEVQSVDYKFLARNLRTQNGPRFIRPVRSDADGRFQIAGIGRERVVELHIEGPSIETVHVRVRTRPGETIRKPLYKRDTEGDPITIYGSTFTHIARPSRTIEGTVADQDTGQPLAGIVVYRERSLDGAMEYISAMTDVQGHYRLTGRARDDKHPILVVAPVNAPLNRTRKAVHQLPADESLPYLPAHWKIPETPGKDPIRFDIHLKRGVYVTGRVLDKSTGQPVHGHVEYYVFTDNPFVNKAPAFRRASTFGQYTAPDGSFGLVAFPGPGVLTVRADHDDYRFGVGIEGSHRVDKQGFLICYPHCPIPGNYHTLALIDPAETDRAFKKDLLLDPGQTLTLNVVGPDGQPVAGSRIAGLKGMGYWERDLPSDASSYKVVGLVPGKPRRITVKHEAKRLVGELLLIGDENGPLTLKLEPWGEIVGRVIGSDGRPWSGDAELSAVAHHSENVSIGKDGRFHITGLIPGQKQRYSLQDNQGSTIVGELFREVTVKPGEVKNLGDLKVTLEIKAKPGSVL